MTIESLEPPPAGKLLVAGGAAEGELLIAGGQQGALLIDTDDCWILSHHTHIHTLYIVIKSAGSSG
jgi:hypothetical protein